MKDDRLRVPVDDPYVVALGQITYGFAVLEWNAVWCAERLNPGFIANLKKKPAGTIARELVALLNRIADPTVKAACEPPVNDFLKLVDTRNGILHGKPGTAPDQSQRLFRHGTAWHTADLHDAADEFAECSVRLNALLYGELRDGLQHVLNP